MAMHGFFKGRIQTNVFGGVPCRDGAQSIIERKRAEGVRKFFDFNLENSLVVSIK